MEKKDNKPNHSVSNKEIIDSSEYTYLPIEDILLACTKIQNNITGEEALLNPYEKMLYVHMRKRYKYFKKMDAERYEKYKKHDKCYYPNEIELAENIAASESTIKRAIKALKKIGLIKVEKSGRSNYYNIENLNNTTFTLFREYKGETVTYVECLVKKEQAKSEEIRGALISEGPDSQSVESNNFDELSDAGSSDVINLVAQQDDLISQSYPWGNAQPFKSNGELSDSAYSWAKSKGANTPATAEELVRPQLKNLIEGIKEVNHSIVNKDEDESIPF